MTQKINKTSTQEKTSNADNEVALAVSSHLGQDLRNSLLIISLVANLFIFTGWIAIQVTTQYDAQLASFLFTR